MTQKAIIMSSQEMTDIFVESAQQKKIGKRFKELIKKYDAIQEVTAHCVNYSKTSISRFCSGKEPLPDYIIESCAKRWGVREEYIKCIDDFETDRDMLETVMEKDSSLFDIHKKYIETLGIKLSAAYWIVFPFEEYSSIEKYILHFAYREYDNTPFCYPFDDLIDADNTFVKTYFSEPHIKKLYQSNYYYALLKMHPMFIEGKNFISILDTIYDDKEIRKPYYGYTFCFALFKNGLLRNYYSSEQLSNFFKILDSYSKCTLDIFMNGKIR